MADKLNKKYKKLPFYLRFIISTLVFIILLILTQNIQIFPGTLLSLFENSERDPKKLPQGVESYFVETADHKKIELWKLPAKNIKPVVLIFHGNGGDLKNFFPYQQYFKNAGYTTYDFDYRGYGKSTGWPSEVGLYADSDAVVEFVLEKEQITKDELIILGISIGSGPSSYIAKKYNPKVLILAAPFTDLESAVKSHPVFGFLHNFIWYDFPVQKNISKLKDTCIIITHGENDHVIPVEHGKSNYENLTTLKHKVFINSDSNHNDVFFNTFAEIIKNLDICLKN